MPKTEPLQVSFMAEAALAGLMSLTLQSGSGKMPASVESLSQGMYSAADMAKAQLLEAQMS